MKLKLPVNPSDTFDISFPHKPFDVVGFGLNSVDHICVVPEYPRLDSKCEILQYEKLPGGQVATAVLFLARMGMRTRYIGKLGGDEMGRYFLSSFQSESIDISSVRIEREAVNQYSFIIVEKSSGERTVLYRRDPRLNFTEAGLERGRICSGRFLHLDGYDGPAALRAALFCRDEGIPVSIDLDIVVESCEDLIRNVDFLIASSDFPYEFTGISDPVKSIPRLRDYCSGFIAVTLGSGGATALVGDRCINFPALRVQAVDTTGAGDIFHAAFIYGVLRNWPLEKIMAFANASAGLSCTRLGAQAGIFPLEQIMEAAESLRNSRQ
jgi:sugar/nucleoside kinase (ribokinase family)